MNDSQFKEKVMYKLGSIENHLETLNDATKKNTEKVAKHDIILGKAGVAVVGILFVITTGVNFLIDWIKSKF